MQSAEDISLHKLAVLVAHLSPDAASALLAELPPTIAALVQNHSEQIGSIEPIERDAILREFREHCEQQDSAPSELDDLPADQIAAVLERERPCIIAAMLTQVSEPKAGQILAALPDELGSRALHLIPKQTFSESISTATQDALRQQVAKFEAEQVASRQMTSIARIANEEVVTREAQNSQPPHSWPPILEEQGGSLVSKMPPQPIQDPPIVVTPQIAPQAKHPVEIRSSHDITPTIQTEFEASPPTFESIVDLEPDVVEAVLEELPAETVLVAIAGSSPHFASRLQQLIHPDDWNHLNAGISQLGAIRLEDIDYAQSIVLNAAQDLLVGQASQSNLGTLRRAG